jgi:hypothetical protein
LIQESLQYYSSGEWLQKRNGSKIDGFCNDVFATRAAWTKWRF